MVHRDDGCCNNGDHMAGSAMSDDLVERVARAFCASDGADPCEVVCDMCLHRAGMVVAVCMEEAAKVAEECAPVSQDTWSTELAERCDMVAAAIRALVKGTK